MVIDFHRGSVPGDRELIQSGMGCQNEQMSPDRRCNISNNAATGSPATTFPLSRILEFHERNIQ